MAAVEGEGRTVRAAGGAKRWPFVKTLSETGLWQGLSRGATQQNWSFERRSFAVTAAGAQLKRSAAHLGLDQGGSSGGGGHVRFQTRSEVKAKRISRKFRCGGVGGGEQGKLTLGFGLISGGDCCWTCEGGFAHEASGGDVEEAGVQVAWSAGKTSGAQTAKFKSYRQTGGLWRYGLKDNRRVGVEREGLWCSILCFHQKQGEGDSAEEMETEMDSPELEAVIL